MYFSPKKLCLFDLFSSYKELFSVCINRHLKKYFFKTPPPQKKYQFKKNTCLLISNFI